MVAIHDDPSPLSGMQVGALSHSGTGEYVVVDVVDWFDRMFDCSWKNRLHDPAFAYVKAYRQWTISNDIPNDDEVLFGYVHGVPRLVHVSEVKPMSDVLYDMMNKVKQAMSRVHGRSESKTTKSIASAEWFISGALVKSEPFTPYESTAVASTAPTPEPEKPSSTAFTSTPDDMVI